MEGLRKKSEPPPLLLFGDVWTPPLFYTNNRDVNGLQKALFVKMKAAWNFMADSPGEDQTQSGRADSQRKGSLK